MNGSGSIPLKVNRRGFLGLGLGAATALGLSGCVGDLAGGSSSGGGTVTLAGGGGTWGDGLRKSFVDDPQFEQKFKATVAQLRLTDGQLLDRLLSQPANPPYDLGDLQESEHILAANAGALQDLDLSIVTNYADILDAAKFEATSGLASWSASMTVGLVVLTWNTKLAKQPKSWNDLWDPKYKGKIAIPAFDWFGLTWMHAVNKSLGGSEGDISKAAEAIHSLVKDNDAKVFTSSDEVNQAFTNEEIVMCPFYNGRTFSLQDNGVPVDLAYVDNTIQLRNGFVVPKNTKVPALANQIINNSLDPDLQLAFARQFKYAPTNTKAKLPDDMKRYMPPSSVFDKVARLDWTVVNDNRPQALETWNKDVIG